MNYIIQDGKNFIAVRNQIEADYHKHWLIQLFITSEGETLVEIEGMTICGHAILVNMDTSHLFHSQGKYHYTVLVDPTTKLGREMMKRLDNQAYYIFPEKEAIQMQAKVKQIIGRKCHDKLASQARAVLDSLYDKQLASLDDRIEKVLQVVNEASEEVESPDISYLARQVFLSESRLAHLFKAETGIPLKSYLVLHKLQKAYYFIYEGKNMTVAAMDAGFSSSSHFAATHKQMTGMAASNIMKDSEFLKVSNSLLC